MSDLSFEGLSGLIVKMSIVVAWRLTWVELWLYWEKALGWET